MNERIERALTWFLAVLLVLSLGAVLYIAVNPPETTDPYTEFYILGPDGVAADYPTELEPGGSGTVIVGISNHEHEDRTYRMVVTWNGSTTVDRTVRVQDEETRELTLNLTAPATPGRYRVRFELYKSGSSSGDPDQWLRLWVDVEE